MTYSEAIQFLYSLQMFGTHFGLERTRQLAAFEGDPQAKLRFIHVAGTNGKGSTCAMLESIYRAAGLRVGLFTSPHLVSFRERIQVNRRLISETEVARLVAEIQPLLRRFPPDAHPTMFEVVAVLALKYFAEQRCDLVILETGLGGRLDATNIVTPLVSVITNIALDHEQWLGDTLAKIAAEKAGIIKPGVPVVTATDAPEALEVIEAMARQKNAPITRVAQVSRLQTASGTDALPLRGEHQKQNAALATATVEALQKQIPVSEANIRTGLSDVNWPGRLQLIQRPDGQKILLDGAHNVAGAETLRAALQSLFPLPAERGEVQGEGFDKKTASSPQPSPPLRKEREKPVLIFGALADKNWPEICRIIAPLAAEIYTVPVASERRADTNELAAMFQRVNPAVTTTACKTFSEALASCKDRPFVVVTGSLYLVGEALESLGVSPANAGERGLNEWSSAR